MNLDVPFYSNTSDDTHCFQAAIKGVAKYFWPNEEYSWEELDEITHKIRGLWTWPTAGILWLQNKGVTIKMVTAFDYDKFIQEGGKYLINEYGQEVGNAQILNSDIAEEQNFARLLIKNIVIERRIPENSDLKDLSNEGFVTICNVNSNELNGLPGYIGHFVVVKGFDESGFYLNDPGLPPLENRKVSFSDFERSWAYPHQKAKNILALKMPG